MPMPQHLISHGTVAAVLSDPRQPDNPIVACNDAFVQLTGYSRDEIVGRNCRFLNSDGTERDQLAALRDAIAQQRPVMVELTNYRKDGSAFRNAVMVAPVFDDAGALAYFLGSQVAIEGAPAGGRERARERVEGLTQRQRQTLEALAAGRLNKQIAYDLGLAERTVKMHRAAMLRALGVKSVAEAIRVAIEAGL